MGWDRGRYYTRSKKVKGQVVREYVGMGRVAQLAARVDALDRERRRLGALERHNEKGRLAALDADMQALIEQIDLAVRAALLAAGFHQHKRGDWRKRRDQDRAAC